MIRVAGDKRNATPGKTYRTEAEARRIAGKEEDKQRQPGAHDPRAGRTTWGQWAPAWWEDRDVAPRTRRSDASHINVHVSPRWSNVALAEISRESVQRWVRDMERSGMAPAHVIRVFHTFSASLHAAVDAGKLAANPCRSVRLPRIPQADERYLTREEVEAITFYLDEPWRSIVLVLCGTGLRWGELAALHWHRVDHDRLHVGLAWDTANLLYKAPKDYERRDVPLLDYVDDALTGLLKGGERPRGRCGAEHPRGLGQRCRSPLVFPGREGAPIPHQTFKHHWQRVVGSWVWHDRKGTAYPTKMAALANDPRAERLWVPGLAGITDPVRIHDMRHTFASWYLHEGGTLPELASVMGHHSVTVTERYAHLQPNRFATARERMAGTGPRKQLAPRLPHVLPPAETNVADLASRRRSEGA
ncbi:site-specific integrase [Pseudonocardia sp. NPDC049635]|uniref:tyrosine-type recombinase/integrase n=1 Tax=Pseudonocardia sp. NPDC049635 TaxID=3155506 RepID=UPI0033CCC29A